ncbi:hypothetical protein DIPPA_18240 [Diplonema papillatum]|nr:hypothetical protein DIPPA_18240 [Diplonema papillatum]
MSGLRNAVINQLRSYNVPGRRIQPGEDWRSTRKQQFRDSRERRRQERAGQKQEARVETVEDPAKPSCDTDRKLNIPRLR